MALRITLGIDPGQTGAISVLTDGEFAHVFDMPIIPRKAGGFHVDGYTLGAQLRGVLLAHPGASVSAFVEQAAARPKQGVTAVFRFGEACGVVRGVLGALRIPFEQVRPQAWKAYLGLVGPQKEASRELAMKRHPSAIALLTRKKDHGRAEAILIADWAETTEQVARTA